MHKYKLLRLFVRILQFPSGANGSSIQFHRNLGVRVKHDRGIACCRVLSNTVKLVAQLVA